MSVYKRGFDETEGLYFLIKDEDFFDIYNEIWEKVSNIIKKQLNSELVHHKEYLKANKKNQHKTKILVYLCMSNIDSFSLQKR